MSVGSHVAAAPRPAGKATLGRPLVRDLDVGGSLTAMQAGVGGRAGRQNSGLQQRPGGGKPGLQRRPAAGTAGQEDGSGRRKEGK